MNEKIGLQDLAVLLVEKSNITPKDAEALVKECFDIMAEGLINDKLLKVQNLGTFKLSWTEDRESIDASTGEKVTIPAHYKVLFSPGIEPAGEINALYAPTETAGIAKNESPAKIEEELGGDDETETEDKVNENPAKSGYFPGNPETQKRPDFLTVENKPQEKFEYRKEELKYAEPYNKDYESAGTTNGLFRLFCIIASGIILLVAGYYLYPGIQHNWNMKKTIPDSVVIVSHPDNQLYGYNGLEAAQETGSGTVQAIDTLPEQTQDFSTAEPVAAPKEQPVVVPKAQKTGSQPAKTQVNKKYKIRKGERLNTIALREYGHKAFWVYIYDENRKMIGNPDLVEPGMVINIPPAAKYGIDKNDQASVNRALELEIELKTKN
jgi:nucleoid DNA-binding protein